MIKYFPKIADWVIIGVGWLLTCACCFYAGSDLQSTFDSASRRERDELAEECVQRLSKCNADFEKANDVARASEGLLDECISDLQRAQGGGK